MRPMGKGSSTASVYREQFHDQTNSIYFSSYIYIMFFHERHKSSKLRMHQEINHN